MNFRSFPITVLPEKSDYLTNPIKTARFIAHLKTWNAETRYIKRTHDDVQQFC